MIRELGLEGGQWELFAVNDNASNAKLGVALSAHLTQHLCDIHTLELVVKDAFNNTPGMKTLLKKTKKLAKYTHKSTVAARELKREAHHPNIRYRKLANRMRKSLKLSVRVLPGKRLFIHPQSMNKGPNT